MTVKIYSAAVVGLDAKIIEVEIDVSYGLRCFSIVGLPDKAIQESKERVSAALKSSGFKSPHSQPERVLVNLAPADLKKEGSLYDLPIALGYLLASNQVKFNPEGKMFVGELSLDGKLRIVKGVLSFSSQAKAQNFSEIVLPQQNAPEAALISASAKRYDGSAEASGEGGKGFKVIGVKNLNQVIGYLKGEITISPFQIDKEKFFKEKRYPISLNWIKGQEYAKRALEIAAAGGHNLL